MRADRDHFWIEMLKWVTTICCQLLSLPTECPERETEREGDRERGRNTHTHTQREIVSKKIQWKWGEMSKWSTPQRWQSGRRRKERWKRKRKVFDSWWLSGTRVEWGGTTGEIKRSSDCGGGGRRGEEHPETEMMWLSMEITADGQKWK